MAWSRSGRTEPTWWLAAFFVAQDARRALNGLQKHFRDLRVQPLSEPVGGRSWCLTGYAGDMSERLTITTVIERWNGIIFTDNGDCCNPPMSTSCRQSHDQDEALLWIGGHEGPGICEALGAADV